MNRLAIAACSLALSLGTLRAEGTETLGPVTGIKIAEGSGIVGAGIGLVNGPGTINIDVPTEATVKQVILYWEGQHTLETNGDGVATVNGKSVTGTRIGGATYFFNHTDGQHWVSTWRADITELGLVKPGSNALLVTDLFDNGMHRMDGAGVFVIYDDGTKANIQVKDGNDLAHVRFLAPLDKCIPMTFDVVEATEAKTVDLVIFVGGVSGWNRPNQMYIGNDVETTKVKYDDPFSMALGAEFDVLNIPVSVPAGATKITVEIVSDYSTTYPERLPASLAWVLAATSEDLASAEECPHGPRWWKRNLDAWKLTGLSPDTTVAEAFKAEGCEFPSRMYPRLAGLTLQQVLCKRTCHWRHRAVLFLLREAVAALLNARHPNVAYPVSARDVVCMTDRVLASGYCYYIVSLGWKFAWLNRWCREWSCN
ncbi:MAG: hypothetical protein R3F30_06775 [Planctomycetota bacterium]